VHVDLARFRTRANAGSGDEERRICDGPAHG
jgi:hypothetical protein